MQTQSRCLHKCSKGKINLALRAKHSFPFFGGMLWILAIGSLKRAPARKAAAAVLLAYYRQPSATPLVLKLVLALYKTTILLISGNNNLYARLLTARSSLMNQKAASRTVNPACLFSPVMTKSSLSVFNAYLPCSHPACFFCLAFLTCLFCFLTCLFRVACLFCFFCL